jgi:hypothetical protein
MLNAKLLTSGHPHGRRFALKSTLESLSFFFGHWIA